MKKDLEKCKPSISLHKILNLKSYLFFIYLAVDYNAVHFYFICSITREIYRALPLGRNS